MKDKNSFYNHYRMLTQLRNASKVLTYGELDPVNLNNRALCSFVRFTKDESVLVIHNISKSTYTIALPENLGKFTKVFFKNGNVSLKGNSLTLPAYSTVILQK